MTVNIHGHGVVVGQGWGEKHLIDDCDSLGTVGCSISGASRGRSSCHVSSGAESSLTQWREPRRTNARVSMASAQFSSKGTIFIEDSAQVGPARDGMKEMAEVRVRARVMVMVVVKVRVGRDLGWG